MLRQTLQILHQILFYWSYLLERTPEAEFLVLQLFPVSLVCVIDKCFLYGKCHCSTTRRQMMTKQFPFSYYFSQFLYQILQTGLTVSIAVLNFVTNSVVISVTVFSLSLQWRYSSGWASASFKSFLHPSRFRATIFQFLHPSLATSSSTPSSQRSLGLPLGHFPPGSLRSTLLDKSSSSWRTTCPAHLSLLSLQNFTMSFSPHIWQSSVTVLVVIKRGDQLPGITIFKDKRDDQFPGIRPS